MLLKRATILVNVGKTEGPPDSSNLARQEAGTDCLSVFIISLSDSGLGNAAGSVLRMSSVATGKYLSQLLISRSRSLH